SRTPEIRGLALHSRGWRSALRAEACALEHRGEARGAADGRQPRLAVRATRRLRVGDRAAVRAVQRACVCHGCLESLITNRESLIVNQQSANLSSVNPSIENPLIVT